MANFLYKTELDGMRTILTQEPISNDVYVYIQDKIYENDVSLFKNKKTNGEKVDLKLVKLADTQLISEEEQPNFKLNQLYSFDNTVFTSANRLNKNQLLQINKKFFVIENIIKNQDKPLELELSEIPFVTATNMYTILQTSQTYEIKIFGRYPSFGEASSVLWKLRAKRDGNYYRFP